MTPALIRAYTSGVLRAIYANRERPIREAQAEWNRRYRATKRP